ncbi:MAG: hypothetical protein PHC33_06705 [Candidatus Omnitrophica bacterium]|nr:hypothetical protein [Candidatus Omnitrophota bacterium]
MPKKFLFPVVCMFFCLAGIVCLRAQSVTDDGSFISAFNRRFDRIEAKIDTLAAAVSSTKTGSREQEILSKLEQVLANQQAVMKELEIIKVRATRK